MKRGAQWLMAAATRLSAMMQSIAHVCSGCRVKNLTLTGSCRYVIVSANDCWTRPGRVGTAWRDGRDRAGGGPGGAGCLIAGGGHKGGHTSRSERRAPAWLARNRAHGN